MNRLLRNIAFGLFGLITLALLVATLLEKLCGTATAMRCVYHSPVLVGLWVAMAVSAVAYLYQRRRAVPWYVVGLHLSLIVILAGAAITFLSGQQGRIRLTEGEEPLSSFMLESGEAEPLPFAVALRSASVEYYPGTSAAMDYVSLVDIVRPDGRAEQGRVSMNNILKVDGYRFYQTSMGEGRSTLSVSHDVWGIGVTYVGYGLFFLSVCAFMVASRNRFLHLFRRVAVVLLVVGVCPAVSAASPVPKTLQKPLAANFGKLYAYWGGRVVPLQTVARDFCLKVYGSASYRGLTPEQVLTGWLFYYDDWKHEPIIKLKGPEIKEVLGLEGKYASLADFYRGGRYLPDDCGTSGSRPQSIMAADEKIGLISSMCTGRGIKIFPATVPGGDGSVEWYSWVDVIPGDAGESAFVSSAMQSLAREIAHGRFNNANEVISIIRDRQITVAGAANLPSELRFGAERLYNRLFPLWVPALLALLTALAALVFRRAVLLQRVVACGVFLYLSLLLILQWIVGGHIPMTNGYETMQTMAWISLLVALLVSFRVPLLGVLATVVASLAMLVAAMSGSNPVVSPLIPVLASPLLSVHVFFVMTSYALFAMMMLNSVVAFFRRSSAEEFRRLADLSRLLLYPAVFALGCGIFIGAVWANQSWGRYWGWDPKETWALITFVVYALPLHAVSFPSFRRPGVIHIYLFLAFLCVLMTYFGVNYLLSGLHSYAG